MQIQAGAIWKAHRSIHALSLDEGAQQLAPLGHVRYVQLEPGAVSVEGAIAELGRTVVCRCGADRNRMEQIDTVPGRITLFVPVRGAGRLGTMSLTSDCAVWARRGTRLITFLDRHFLGVSISVEAQCLQNTAADLRLKPPMGDSEICVLDLPAVRVAAIDRLVQEMLTLPGAEPNAAAASARMAVMEGAVVHLIVTLLGSHPPRQSTGRESTARIRAVVRARDFIDAHLDQPLSLAKICQASYASARALEYGFREAFALSPMAYVRCARLSRVRHELFLADPRPKAVTQLAMKWGFWHLGQFSRDYRAFFGELPSATLARSSDSVGCVIPLRETMDVG
jgi:AraC family transcriptional regulator, ethanolamine operon transcriptional activator